LNPNSFLNWSNVHEVYAKKYMLGKKNVRTVRMGKREFLYWLAEEALQPV